MIWLGKLFIFHNYLIFIKLIKFIKKKDLKNTLQEHLTLLVVVRKWLLYINKLFIIFLD